MQQNTLTLTLRKLCCCQTTTALCKLALFLLKLLYISISDNYMSSNLSNSIVYLHTNTGKVSYLDVDYKPNKKLNRQMWCTGLFLCSLTVIYQFFFHILLEQMKQCGTVFFFNFFVLIVTGIDSDLHSTKCLSHDLRSSNLINLAISLQKYHH